MKHLYVLILLGFSLTSFSQEDPLYAQYLNNPLLINPAYTGLNDNFNASISYRKQWAGFEGNPTTANVSGHTSLADNKMGVGVLIVQDKIGVNKNTEGYATYSYRLNFNNHHLSFGLQAGFINYKTDNSGLNIYDPDDPAFNNINLTKPSFGAGIILHSDRYFIGISVPRMLRASTQLSNQGNKFNTSLYDQHYYASLAYVFYLSERVRFKPSTLMRVVKGAPLSMDYNASFNIDEKYTAGVFLRNTNACGLLTQVRFAEAYRIAYAFEVPIGNSVGSRFTSHEICFGLNMAVLGSHKTAMSNF